MPSRGKCVAALILTIEALILAGVGWAVVSVPGCANGMTTGEAAFAIRAGLVLEGEPTSEQLQGLVADALSHAEARLTPEQYEAVRVLSAAALALYDNGGEWRPALIEMLAAIEAGGGA